MPFLTIPRGIAEVLRLSAPLNLSRVVLCLFQAAEAALLPLLLIRSGMTDSDALALYGVLSGMVLPLLLFPNCFYLLCKHTAASSRFRSTHTWALWKNPDCRPHFPVRRPFARSLFFRTLFSLWRRTWNSAFFQQLRRYVHPPFFFSLSAFVCQYDPDRNSARSWKNSCCLTSEHAQSRPAPG